VRPGVPAGELARLFRFPPLWQLSYLYTFAALLGPERGAGGPVVDRSLGSARCRTGYEGSSETWGGGAGGREEGMRVEGVSET